MRKSLLLILASSILSIQSSCNQIQQRTDIKGIIVDENTDNETIYTEEEDYDPWIEDAPFLVKDLSELGVDSKENISTTPNLRLERRKELIKTKYKKSLGLETLTVNDIQTKKDSNKEVFILKNKSGKKFILEIIDSGQKRSEILKNKEKEQELSEIINSKETLKFEYLFYIDRENQLPKTNSEEYHKKLVALFLNNKNADSSVLVSLSEYMDTDTDKSSYNASATFHLLKTILDIEKNFPGFFVHTISKNFGLDGKYSSYLINQTSSNSRGVGYKYQRPITKDYKYINQPYDREDKEEKPEISNLKIRKNYEASKIIQKIIMSSMSTLKSDMAKGEIFPDLINREYCSTHLDMNRSTYEAIRDIYKNGKDKLDSAPKNFSLIDFMHGGFNMLKTKNDPHLLEQIIVRNFNGLFLEEKKLLKDEFSYSILTWTSLISDTIASLDINNRINEKNELFKNQKYYNTFCCMYELYHDLIFVLLAYNNDKKKPIYNYKDYKEAVEIECKERLPKFTEEIKKEHFVTKSGMDAITKALMALHFIDENSNKYSPTIIPICSDRNTNNKVEEIYFEIPENVSCRFKNKLPVPTIISGISCARYSLNGKYDTEKIIVESIQNENCVLILDSTIQLPSIKEDPIYIILEDKRIQNKLNDGTLVILLAKSFQKFATLGTQKMRAGDLTVIGNDFIDSLYNKIVKILSEKFDDLFTPKTWGAELQWLTHLLTYTQTNPK